MTALKRARLATGMSKRQAAEYLWFPRIQKPLPRLSYIPVDLYRHLERADLRKEGPAYTRFCMILTMKLWNKCYHDRYRYGGIYRNPFG
jgi:hypothetical protein